MWFGETPLTPEDGTTGNVESVREKSAQDALVASVHDVLGYVRGTAELDLDCYVNPNARFVDVHAAVHSAKQKVPARNVLGIDIEGFVVEREEYIGVGETWISVLGFVQHGSDGTLAQMVTWTMTWQLAQGGWRILNSHASRN